MKGKQTSFDWDRAEQEFIQTRIVSLPAQGFTKALDVPVFDVDKKMMGLLTNMVDEQLRTVYHSVSMMLDRMEWVEKVQGISPKVMTCEDGLKEILPIVRSANTFREGFQLYDSGNFGGSYTGGTCESGSDGRNDGFADFGRIVDFALNIEDLTTEPILDRARVWAGIRCCWEKNFCLLKFKLAKKIISQEIRGL